MGLKNCWSVSLIIALTMAGCSGGGDGGAGGENGGATAGGAEAESGADAEAASAGGGAIQAGRWQGVVTGGYDGNVISFMVAGDGSISEITFEGHWDCADGIESTIMGPGESYPTAAGVIDITSVDPPDGGATSTRFVLNGQIRSAEAAGMLRANINALGCDTGELSWTAAPALISG